MIKRVGYHGEDIKYRAGPPLFNLADMSKTLCVNYLKVSDKCDKVPGLDLLSDSNSSSEFDSPLFVEVVEGP